MLPAYVFQPLSDVRCCNNNHEDHQHNEHASVERRHIRFHERILTIRAGLIRRVPAFRQLSVQYARLPIERITKRESRSRLHPGFAHLTKTALTITLPFMLL